MKAKYTAAAQMFLLLLTATSCAHASEKAAEKPAEAAAAKPKEKAEMPKFSLSKLQKSYKGMQSLEADILQEVYQASLGRTKTSKGNLKLSKPNFVRWEIEEPASVLVSNGSKLFYYVPDALGKGRGQVTISKANQLAKQPLFRILTGASSLAKEFKIEKESQVDGAKEGEKWTELVLTPQKKLNDIVKVALKVDSKYLIRELTTENESGNKTKISLQNQALGSKLPPALFDFKPPPGSEILQN